MTGEKNKKYETVSSCTPPLPLYYTDVCFESSSRECRISPTHLVQEPLVLGASSGTNGLGNTLGVISSSPKLLPDS